uniref:Uncharacterized protein n=1 Tax=Romanomermis culicivorax TaxID=13658 RepID=A0A915IW37_ROMCU
MVKDTNSEKCGITQQAHSIFPSSFKLFPLLIKRPNIATGTINIQTTIHDIKASPKAIDLVRKACARNG